MLMLQAMARLGLRSRGSFGIPGLLGLLVSLRPASANPTLRRRLLAFRRIRAPSQWSLD